MKRSFSPWEFLICFEVALEAIRLRDSIEAMDRNKFLETLNESNSDNFEDERSEKCGTGDCTININCTYPLYKSLNILSTILICPMINGIT